MDSNQQRFWMLAAEEDWNLRRSTPAVRYDSECGNIQLIRQRPQTSDETPEASTEEVRAIAVERLRIVPMTRDRVGTRAFYDSGTRTIFGAGAAPGAFALFPLPATATLTDMTVGYDGILYLAIDGKVRMIDLLGRWTTVEIPDGEISADRLAPCPGGGVWVLSIGDKALGRVTGAPLPDRPEAQYDGDVFRPCQENPYPPRLARVAPLVFAGETLVGIASDAEDRLGVLTWTAHGLNRIRYRQGDGAPVGPVTLQQSRFAYSAKWVSADRIAIITPESEREALVYELLDQAQSLSPVGDYYPLTSAWDKGPFVQTIIAPPHYPSDRDSIPLLGIKLPLFTRTGDATNQSLIDSGNAQTVWHRLYVEADIPAHCSLRVLLAASNEAAAPPSPDDWYEHRFGHDLPDPGGSIPTGAWCSAASEIPFHQGFLKTDRQKLRAGLFTVLIQRSGRAVRSLRGRYLWIRIWLNGDGRSTPSVSAVRAYASRFSYRDNYLPTLYREDVFGPDADLKGASTRADFLDRFLATFESVLTPLEDRVASAHLLTHPRSVPNESLPWLASWLGLTFDAGYPEERRRDLLEALPFLYKWRGTVRGISRALDIATGGALSRGQIILIEDFRLRRTFATILGADLSNTDDPLLAGLSSSGNSIVGDTLFLGSELHPEFLALFSADLPKTPAEQRAVDLLFEKLAHRLTVFVHKEMGTDQRKLIARVLDQETPAHVQWAIKAATHPFLVGVASLVNVDTFLDNRPRWRTATVGESELTTFSRLERVASLDPRLDTVVPRQQAERPVAAPEVPAIVPEGENFTLDASASHAATGRNIVEYIWTLLG